ncbi:hypothetical protein BDV95DRAFT_613513 [Massariosphaeria phaeospora]|uniref:Uncharacterized protein n=1 Tax=Massariosphaeria phaeospora TaxID=100035 RepID=A0A7C8MNP5_9PLEO|nr:hypothetical protein BDV95DRAFT_613513 [Massariosphaeria phaeospora]
MPAKRGKAATAKKHPLATTQSSPFFVLPRELRDMVYHEIWRTTTPIYVEFNGISFVVEYDASEATSATGATSRKPAQTSQFLWILSNKQLAQEAMAQFERDSTWTVVDLGDYEPTAPTKRPQFTAERPSLTPWRAKALKVPRSIVMDQMIQLGNRLRNVQDSMIFSNWCIDFLMRLGPCNTNGSTLRSLELKIRILAAYELPTNPNNRFSTDIQRLTALAVPNLSSVKLTFTILRKYLTQYDNWVKFKEEVSRIGGELVGGNHTEVLSTVLTGDPLQYTWKFERA